MDTSKLGYCTTPNGGIVAYQLSEGLPSWSLEAQQQASRGEAPAAASSAEELGPHAQGVGAGAPAEAAPEAAPEGQPSPVVQDGDDDMVVVGAPEAASPAASTNTAEEEAVRRSAC